jgi:toxin secretion/phage lysis holin
MKTVWSWLQTAFAAIGGFLGWFLGGLDGFVFALAAFVVIDYLTGVARAIVNKELSSAVGARGILKKLLIFTLVGAAHLIDQYVLQNGSAVRSATIFFYLSNEGVSMMENASAIGLPVPDKLKSVLAQLHNHDEAGDGQP